MRRSVFRALIVAALGFVVPACGGGSSVDRFLGSFDGTTTTTLTPTGGTSRTQVTADILVNGSDLTSDDAPGDLQLRAQGDWDCVFVGVVDGDDATFDEAECTLTETSGVTTLDGNTAVARRTGNQLTIDVAGTFTGTADSGAFSTQFLGTFSPGTRP